MKMFCGTLPGPKMSWVFRTICGAPPGGVIVMSGVVGVGGAPLNVGPYFKDEVAALPVAFARSDHSPATWIVSWFAVPLNSVTGAMSWLVSLVTPKCVALPAFGVRWTRESLEPSVPWVGWLRVMDSSG